MTVIDGISRALSARRARFAKSEFVALFAEHGMSRFLEWQKAMVLQAIDATPYRYVT